MTKKIIFNPCSKIAELSVPPPKPAEHYTPRWFKQIKPFSTPSPKFCSQTASTNQTVKKCMPFSDSFDMGYIQETWEDIWIEKNESETNFYFPSGPQIMSSRGPHGHVGFPEVEEYIPTQFTWHPPWWLELPPGYSCIVTHPLNHDDLPFHTFAGIVDSDTYHIPPQKGNIPFLLKKNFCGMIKKGTPMYQIIPFKRENWESSFNEYDGDRQTTIQMKIRQYFWDGYRKLHWKKKQFK